MTAQSFNTITNAQSRYKVDRVPIYIREDISPENTDSIEPVDTTTVEMPKETEWDKYPLQISYPLHQSKLHVTSPYGWRILNHSRTFHSGIDLRAKYELVYAMLGGKVINIGYESKGGNFISLKHGPIKVTYCHLFRIAIKKGDTVYAGQVIGISGNSGRSTGPHLHIQVKDARTGHSIDPTELFRILNIPL